MRLTPVDILANWYNDETLPWSAQKAVNCLAETAEVGGTRSVVKTKGLPGRTLLADLGTGAPIRGAEDVEGRLMVVSGTSLFEIHPNNSFTNRGTIPGVGLVSIAHNKQGGTTAANEVAIANGLSGYVYNTDTTALVQITDDAFPGATTFDYCDGYTTFTDPEGRFWGHSALNQATQYSSIDRYDAESAPDKIISHIVSHREVMVFGTRTIEFFRNTGAATGTFQRVDGTEMEVGIAAPLARARMDNTVYWLGSDGLVYRLAGHSPQRVSTRPIEQAISRFNLANAFAHTWEDRGHQVFYLTFPDGLTFGYDVATSLWHARETYGLQRWGVNTTTYWNRLWVAGDYASGKLHTLNWDDFTEDGRPLVMECQPGVTHADQNRVLCPYVELVMDTGQSPNPATLDPLQISGNAPDSFVDVPYSFSYSASGGFGIYTFSVASGTVPTGLTLSPSGVLSGVVSANGVFPFTVTVTDSLGNTASVPDTISVLFSSDLITVTAGDMQLRSGLTSAYAVSSTLPGQSFAVSLFGMGDGTIVGGGGVASPFFRGYFFNGTVYTTIPSPLSPGVTVNASFGAYTKDGAYLVVRQTTAGQIWLYKRDAGLNTYTRVQTIAVGGNVPGSIVWDETGEYLATGGNSPFLRVYRRAGDVLTIIATVDNLDGEVSFTNRYSPGTLHLAYARTNSVPRMYTVVGNTVTLVGAGSVNQPGNGTAAYFSRNGRFLYLRTNIAPFLAIYEWTGTQFTMLATPGTPPVNSAGDMTLSADGRAMAIGDGAAGVKIYTLDSSTGAATFVSTIAINAQDGVLYVNNGRYMDP